MRSRTTSWSTSSDSSRRLARRRRRRGRRAVTGDELAALLADRRGAAARRALGRGVRRHRRLRLRSGAGPHPGAVNIDSSDRDGRRRRHSRHCSREHGVDTGARIVCYCHSGSRSALRRPGCSRPESPPRTTRAPGTSGRGGAQLRPRRLLRMDGAFAHTCYRVLDPAASIKFYTECLGLEHVRAAPIRDEATNHLLRLPGRSRALARADAQPRPHRAVRDRHRLRPHRDHGRRPRRDARRARREGRAARAPPYSVRERSRICFVRDPDGYRIELIERK